jgi:type IX secretion system PorP/SprF family membrane protein
MRSILVLALLFLTTAIFAQQDPLYGQYLFNPLLINPAYSGINNNFSAMVGYRTQWTGFEGHPETFYASGNTSVLANKLGAGLLVINDQVGNISNTESNLALSYKLNLRHATFSYGMQVGFQHYTTSFADLNVYDQGDNAFMGGETGTRINIGAGAVLTGDKYFIGFSVPRLLPTTFKNAGQEFELYNRHYYLHVAYLFYLSDRLRFKPTALLRGVADAPANIDVAFNMNIDGQYTAGLFTRNLNTYGVLLQATFKNQLRAGYTFEIPSSNSVGSNFNTHEVNLGIMLSIFSYHEESINNF